MFYYRSVKGSQNFIFLKNNLSRYKTVLYFRYQKGKFNQLDLINTKQFSIFENTEI